MEKFAFTSFFDYFLVVLHNHFELSSLSFMSEVSIIGFTFEVSFRSLKTGITLSFLNGMDAMPTFGILNINMQMACHQRYVKKNISISMKNWFLMLAAEVAVDQMHAISDCCTSQYCTTYWCEANKIILL